IEKAAAIAHMKVLNRDAADALHAAGDAVHAVTDVTGFGLFGHGWEVAERSRVRLVFDGSALPLYEGALRPAQGGVRTGGDARNRQPLEGVVAIDEAIDASLEALAYDPQTSGGLLASVDRSAAPALVEAGFAAIGLVEAGDPGVAMR